MKKGDDDDMPSTAEKLAELNKKIDSDADRFWKQAELNLKKLEEDYKKRKEGRKD